LTYFFETYGCQMNIAESAALNMALRERGWSPAADAAAADLVVINTCSVRATAEQRVFGRLALYTALKKKRAAEERPFTLVIAGCMASRLGESLKAKAAVDYVMGTDARSTFPLILESVEKGGRFIPDAEEKPVFSFSPFHLEGGEAGGAQTGGSAVRSFVPIMHGCSNFCSYCIVPSVRGPEISRDPAAILAEIRMLADKGVREITLLGQNVNSYCWNDGSNTQDGSGEKGKVEKKIDFPALLEMVALEAEKTGGKIRWIRFLSSHPKDFSTKTIEVMARHPCFCRHLHLCVQHGSDRVLEAMNRRYTRAQYLALAAEIRAAMPAISLSTDILVGFPGETDEDVEETLGLMRQVKFLYSYMYHYNPREGTAAFGLPDQVPGEVKRRRLSKVIDLQKQHTLELLKARVGARALVLVEGISRKNAGEVICRTERDEMVVAPGNASLIGKFAEGTLSSLKGNTFRAKELICGD
jgi:tRNA-2-methylthio-N6-dimethylallyladenosine synthase